MIDILQYAKQFKNCERVAYTAYVCKVPAGSCVLNPISDYKAVCLLGGKLFLSCEEVLQIQQNNVNLWNLIRGRLTNSWDFIININGTLSVISFDSLKEYYSFEDGSPITHSRLLPKSYICEVQNGVVTPVDITLITAYRKKMENPEANLVIRWFKVRWYGSFEEEVLFINRVTMPEFRPYLPEQNKNYVVIVANSDERTAKIITEDEYKYKYNLKGKKLDYKREPMKIPEPLFELSKSMNGVKTFAIAVDNAIKRLYDQSFAKVQGVVVDISTEILSRDCLSISFNVSFASVFFLAFTKNKEYCLASGNREVFTEGYGSDIEKYLKHLKSDKSVMFSESSFKTYMELLVAFLTLENSSVISNYYNPPLTTNELVSLKKYSGIEYENINKYLRGRDVEDNFSAYLRATFIQEIIEKSRILRNQYHFRGALLDTKESAKVKEGYVIKHPTFLSTTLVSSVTFDFIGQEKEGYESILLVFRNTTNKHGIYIDNFSVHRGKEFEVLMGVGTNFRMVRKLGYYHEVDCKPCPIWLCEVEDDPNVKLRRYAYQKDAVEKLLYMIQSSDLMKAFYISDIQEGDRNQITLLRYNTEDLTIIIALTDGVFNIEFIGCINEEYSFSIKEKGYNHLFQYIYHMLNTSGIDNYFGNSALSSFSEKFMLDLMSTFTYNGFIISEQQVNIGVFEDVFGGTGDLFSPVLEYDMATGKHIDARKSDFTILNANAKPIKFDIRITTDNKSITVELVATENKKKPITKKFSCGVAERFTLYEKVYLAIVNRFNLDPVRRLKHIFSIVSGYYEKYIEFSGRSSKYVCAFDDRLFEIQTIGADVTISYQGNSIDIHYFDDIYESASKIQTLI